MSDEPTTGHEANRAYLVRMREVLRLTQGEMANLMGMSLRAYSDLETGKAKCRLIHILAAERLTLQQAKLREDGSLLARPVRQEAVALRDRGLL